MKKRIITIFTYKNHTLVKSIKYQDYRNVNSIYSAIKLFNKRGIDEIIFLNLDHIIDFDLLRSFASEVDIPMTYGGQIKNIDEMTKIFEVGFDKICLNSLLYTDLDIVIQASKIFGKQSLCASVDVKFTDNDYYCFYNNASINSKITLANQLDKLIQNDCIGEVIITNVERDGTMLGFDINLYDSLKKFPIRILANGGGNNDITNLRLIKNDNIKGLCFSSLFFFTQFTPKIIKEYLKDVVSLVNI